MDNIEAKKFLIKFLKSPETQKLLGVLTTSDKEENAKNYTTLKSKLVSAVVDANGFVAPDIALIYSQFIKIIYTSIPNIFEYMYEIPQASFYHCKWLTEIDVPNGVMCISENAFRDTGLQVISIPRSVTTLCRCSLDLDHPITINYDGTSHDFDNIVKDTFWKSSINPITVNCTDGKFEIFMTDDLEKI